VAQASQAIAIGDVVVGVNDTMITKTFTKEQTMVCDSSVPGFNITSSSKPSRCGSVA